ncbi:MAG: type IV pilus modification protein PilV [Deltaproteobacteria bacterium]|nr:type IV pilus modification protein PilV [Deltaproteobacteria bacterium]
MRRLKDTKGFTLLEVLITLIILSVGLLGLASMQIMAVKGNSFGQQMTVASTLAQNKLEELRKANFDSIANGNDTYSDQINGVSYTRQWTVQDDTPEVDAKTVVIAVSWEGTQANRSVILSTIISRL